MSAEFSRPALTRAAFKSRSHGRESREEVTTAGTRAMKLQQDKSEAESGVRELCADTLVHAGSHTKQIHQDASVLGRHPSSIYPRQLRTHLPA